MVGIPATATPAPPRPAAPCRAPLAALAAVVLAAAVALAACQKSQRRDSADEALSRPIAVVNNEQIGYEEFQDHYQLFLTRWDRFIHNDPRKKREIKELLLERMIDRKLLDQEARRKGIEISDAELNAETVERIASFEGVESGRDGVDAKGLLDRDALVEWSRDLRRRLIHRKLIHLEVVDKIRLSAAELRAYYDRHKKSFYRPERVKVRHIAVGSRSLYNRVARLLRRKHDFVELVHKYSITPDRLADGELGFVERGVLPEEFDEAIFKMKRVGSTSVGGEPVKTQIGYHIFKLEGRQPEGQLSFREALPKVRKRLRRQKQAAAYRQWLDGLRGKATIKIDEALLAAE